MMGWYMSGCTFFFRINIDVIRTRRVSSVEAEGISYCCCWSLEAWMTCWIWLPWDPSSLELEFPWRAQTRRKTSTSMCLTEWPKLILGSSICVVTMSCWCGAWSFPRYPGSSELYLPLTLKCSWLTTVMEIFGFFLSIMTQWGC